MDEVAYEQLLKVLSPFKAVVFNQSSLKIIPTTFSIPKEAKSQESPDQHGGNNKSASKTKTLEQVPDEAMQDLIHLIHANINSKNFIAKEFLEFWSRKDQR